MSPVSISLRIASYRAEIWGKRARGGATSPNWFKISGAYEGSIHLSVTQSVEVLYGNALLNVNTSTQQAAELEGRRNFISVHTA